MKATIQLSPTWIQAGPPEHPHLFTEKELAVYLRVCRRQLFTWRMKGIIPYMKIGKAVRFRLSDVEAALATRTIQHKPQA